MRKLSLVCTALVALLLCGFPVTTTGSPESRRINLWRKLQGDKARNRVRLATVDPELTPANADKLDLMEKLVADQVLKHKKRSGELGQGPGSPGRRGPGRRGRDSPNRSAAGPCRSEDAPIVFYNRVPKCASTSQLRLLERLAHTNNFEFELQRSPKRYRQPELPQLRQLDQLCGPIVYANHQRYADPAAQEESFPKLERNLVYYNIIRDPFSRANSAFHYAVNKDLRGQRAVEAVKQRRKDRCGCAELSFSQCVERAEEMGCPQNVVVTKNNDDSLLHYIADDRVLAGFDVDQDCEARLAGKVAGVSRVVNDTLRFMRQRYVFVSLVEEYGLGLKVLERKLPRFFKHAPTLAKQVSSSQRRVSGGPSLSQRARELLEAHPCNLNEMVFFQEVGRYFWETVHELRIPVTKREVEAMQRALGRELSGAEVEAVVEQQAGALRRLQDGLAALIPPQGRG